MNPHLKQSDKQASVPRYPVVQTGTVPALCRADAVPPHAVHQHEPRKKKTPVWVPFPAAHSLSRHTTNAERGRSLADTTRIFRNTDGHNSEHQREHELPPPYLNHAWHQTRPRRSYRGGRNVDGPQCPAPGRRSDCQPPNRRDVHIVAACNVGLCLASLKPRTCLLPLDAVSEYGGRPTLTPHFSPLAATLGSRVKVGIPTTSHKWPSQWLPNTPCRSER